VIFFDETEKERKVNIGAMEIVKMDKGTTLFLDFSKENPCRNNRQTIGKSKKHPGKQMDIPGNTITDKQRVLISFGRICAAISTTIFYA
jgi:hypothetical protein